MLASFVPHLCKTFWSFTRGNFPGGCKVDPLVEFGTVDLILSRFVVTLGMFYSILDLGVTIARCPVVLLRCSRCGRLFTCSDGESPEVADDVGVSEFRFA